MDWPATCSVCGLALNESYFAHMNVGFPPPSTDHTVVAAYCSRECLESAELYDPTVPVAAPDEEI
jgi:hypothetical protein